jgi:hypothetical protein
MSSSSFYSHYVYLSVGGMIIQVLIPSVLTVVLVSRPIGTRAAIATQSFTVLLYGILQRCLRLLPYLPPVNPLIQNIMPSCYKH